MKDKKMVITTTYSLFSVLWGIAAAGILVVVFSSIFSFFVDVPSTLNVPARIEIKNPDIVNEIKLKMSSEPFYTISQFETSFFVSKPTFIQNAISALFNLVWVLSFYLCVHLLRRIIKRISDNDEFNQKNIYDTKFLAYVIMLAPAVIVVLKFLFIITATGFSFNGKKYVYDGLTVTIKNSIGYDFIIYAAIGGVIYILALVFDQGKKLKEENDLTV